MLCLVGGMENREWWRVKYLGEKKKRKKGKNEVFSLSYYLVENKEKKKENI